jgi:hypothetical protein
MLRVSEIHWRGWGLANNQPKEGIVMRLTIRNWGITANSREEPNAVARGKRRNAVNGIDSRMALGVLAVVSCLVARTSANANPESDRGGSVRQNPSLELRRQPSAPGSEEWLLSLSSAHDEESVRAWIDKWPDSVVVGGSIGNVPFLLVAERSPSGLVREARALGSHYFAGEFHPANRGDFRNEFFATQLDAFRRGNSPPPGNVARGIDSLRELAHGGLNEESKQAVDLVLAAIVGTSAESNSIDSYVRCLRAACRQNGGCWAEMSSFGGCHACPNDPFRVKLYSYILYTIDAEICFVGEILDPIRPEDVDEAQ